MNVELTYNKLISELEQRFPQFPIYLGDLRAGSGNNVSVYFSFFSIYLKEHWTEPGLLKQLALLLAHMHATGDEATQITLHDFLLFICSSCREHDIDLQLLMQELTPELQNQLLHINDQWQTAACALHRGCCG